MAISPISPRLTKGAFIEFSNRFGRSWIPNVIIFQYNPGTIKRTLEGWKEDSDKEKEPLEGATAQPFDPGETIDFKLELDASDLLDNPARHPLAVVAGVTDRIAAIEMLMYPEENTTLKGLLASTAVTLGGAVVSAAGVGFGSGLVGAGAGAAVTQGIFAGKNMVTQLEVPRGTVPTVLFAWSPGRIVPVRIVGLTVEEQEFTPNLYVMRAEIEIKLKILAPKNIPCKKSDGDKKAVTAYNIYQRQKRDFAAMNMANQAVDAVQEFFERGKEIF